MSDLLIKVEVKRLEVSLEGSANFDLSVEERREVAQRLMDDLATPWGAGLIDVVAVTLEVVEIEWAHNIGDALQYLNSVWVFMRCFDYGLSHVDQGFLEGDISRVMRTYKLFAQRLNKKVRQLLRFQRQLIREPEKHDDQ